MTTPITTYVWATDNVGEYVTSPDGLSSVLVLNKVAPDVATLQSGVRARQPLVRPYYNYVLNSHGQWIDHLRAGEIGDYKFMPTATTITDMTNRFSGTWVDHGTDTFAGQTRRVFDRTA